MGTAPCGRGVDAAMNTDRSLATLLRALQSGSDEQDVSRSQASDTFFNLPI